MHKSLSFFVVACLVCLSFIGGRATASNSAMITVTFQGGPLNGQSLNASPFINWLEYEEDGVVLTVHRYEPKFPNWSNVLVYQGDE